MTAFDSELNVFVEQVEMIPGSIERGNLSQTVVTLQITSLTFPDEDPQPVVNVHIQARRAEEIASAIVRAAHEARDQIGD